VIDGTDIVDTAIAGDDRRRGNYQMVGQGPLWTAFGRAAARSPSGEREFRRVMGTPEVAQARPGSPPPTASGPALLKSLPSIRAGR
jgi:hypothetical protein